jgi:hypothetical protein
VGQFHAIEVGHLDIQEEQIGLLFLDGVDGFYGVGNEPSSSNSGVLVTNDSRSLTARGSSSTIIQDIVITLNAHLNIYVINVILEPLLPGVATGIHQIQAATGVLQSDTRAAAVGIVLGIVRIFTGKDDTVVLLFQVDVNHRTPAAAHPVFEGILDE